MAIDVKKVLREKPGSFLSYFLPLLVTAEDNVELIDCLELFGLDRLAEALERLGGSRIVFPTWATIDPLVKDAYLVTRLESLFGEPNSETRARLEAEFEAPYDLLLFRARSVKSLIRRAGIERRGGYNQGVPVPGTKEAKRYLQKIKKTNREIRRAVKEAERETSLTLETETVVPYGARTIGEAVLALELWSRRVHSAQRLALLDRLSVPDRVSRLMRDVNRSLSSPDEDRERAYARRANELLRNSAVKGHLASFLALEGQIERLASITASQGEIDRTLSNPDFLAQLDANQLIALQRSQHTQMLEILELLEKKKYDGLSAVTSLLSVRTEEEVKTGLEELSKLKPGSRELVGVLLNKILTNLATRRSAEVAVAAQIEKAAQEENG